MSHQDNKHLIGANQEFSPKVHYGILRENRMVDSCAVSGDTAGVTTRRVVPHTPVNQTVFSYYNQCVLENVIKTLW